MEDFFIKNMPGDLVQVSLDSLDLIRTNYNSSDNRNFRDGDTESSRFFNMGNDESQKMYNSPSESESNLNKQALPLSVMNLGFTKVVRGLIDLII